MNSTWPNWIINAGLIATFIGTFFTFFVLYQTSKLSGIYNKKINVDHLTSNIKFSYEKLHQHIMTLSNKSIEDSIKHEIWNIIVKCNVYVSACTKKDTDKDIYFQIEKFTNSTSSLNIYFNSKDSLTYEAVWKYYNSLTILNVALSNAESINARKV